MPQHIATWNPTTQLWETDQIDLFSGRSEPFSATFPTSGMTRSGQLWPLPMSAHRIGGNEYSSLLPTPAAGNFNDRESPESWQARQATLKDGFGMPLAVAVKMMLPTPRATDGTKGGPNQRESSGDLMLPSAVINLE